jgi:hypothetical protein
MKYRIVLAKADDDIAEVVINHATTDPAAETDWRALAARRNSRNYTMSEKGKPFIVRGYMSTYKPGGQNKIEFKNDDSYWANMDANPATMAFLGIHFQNHSAASARPVFWTAYLEFFCEFRRRVTIESS